MLFPCLAAPSERVAVLLEVPTLTEQGFPAEVGGWFGVLAPAGTPPEAIAWLNRETTKVFSAPETRDRFVQQGAAVPLGTPGAFGKFIARELPAYAQPLFVRILPAIETTGTFKVRKLDLIADGFDPGKIKGPLFVHDPKRGYVKVTKGVYEKIAAGVVKV